MVKKTDKTNKTTKATKTTKTKKTSNAEKTTKATGAARTKKECCCLTAPKIAIIVVLAAAVALLVALFFAMFIKNKNQVLTCDFAYDEAGTNIHLEYSYGMNSGKPNKAYLLTEMKAADEQEAADWVALREGDENDETFMTLKYWNEGNSFYTEFSQDEAQINAVLEDEKMKEEYDYTSVDDTKAELEASGYVCSVK